MLAIDPHANIADGEARICRHCDVDVRQHLHHPECEVVTRLVRRMGLTPEDRRLDDLLISCTRRALAAWVASGRTI